ncbi:ferrous iron transport protein A [Acetobacter sicerae]|uniref:Ferrous iron transport protein A n=1 Tax=Acetobacter sicerae TaxID=85325 RepID=A0ABS8VXN2_9PROT|nr:FeoA family protein [Acetobacter sicerae]MCE0744103.1 ferrous iron transport protein A [Acetobacter sicerae]NHN91880.1 ferrous iron transport protein A [Acetobacter sicerae]
MRLDELPAGIDAIIDHIDHRGADDTVAQRLGELGFVPGEPLRIVAIGPFGGDPLAVKIGFTRFALRRSEASRVILQDVA